MPRAAAVCALLVAFASFAFQDSRKPPREPPPVTDVDPQLTEQFRQLEQERLEETRWQLADHRPLLHSHQ